MLRNEPTRIAMSSACGSVTCTYL